MANAEKLAGAKMVVLLALMLLVLAAYVSRERLFFMLAWPGLVLARWGMNHAWVVLTAILLGATGWTAWHLRQRDWWQVLAVGVLAPFVYCEVAFFSAVRISRPVPAANPYAEKAEIAKAYAKAYDEGYFYGLFGRPHTYCFAATEPTRGYYEGSYEGYTVFNRFLGRTMSEDIKHWYGITAARDGVTNFSK